LREWPKVATAFQDMVKNVPERNVLPMNTFSKPILSLMEMVARNTLKSRYYAIEENFLMAAVHVAAMRDIPFAEGSVPDLPGDIPMVPVG
jgi:hypothetical protein